MSYENKGSMGPTITVSREPDQSGNFVCDGAADDVQIQAAIDALPATGGTVLCKSGTYDISAVILIQNLRNVILSGVGWQATRFITSGVDTIAITIGDRVNAGNACQNIVVRDLYIDGTSQTTETSTPEANERRFGIQFASPAEETLDVLIENCYIYNTGSDSIYGFNPGRFITQSNIIEATRGYWGSIHPHGSPNDGQILDNIIFDSDVSGIRHSKVIMGNYVENCGAGGETNGTEACIVGSDDAVIVGNYVGPNNAGGVVGIKTFGETNVVAHNAIDSAPGACIHVFGGNGHVVDGNNIYDTSSANGAIFVDDTIGCVIKGNSIDRAVQGINLEGAINCSVIGNILADTSKQDDNTVDAIILQASNGTNSVNNAIIGNQIYSTIANEPRYGINENDANQDFNVIKDNVISNAATALAKIMGPNTRLAKAQFQFTEAIVGAISTTSPTGVDVDANTEQALAWGQIPTEVQEVQRIKIWAVATDAPIGGGGQMHLEITFNAGASNAAYNEAGKSWNLVNFDGEEADYVANDVVHWVIEDGDVSNEILALQPGDSFEMFAIHEAGADPDGATDALFRVVEVEYV